MKLYQPTEYTSSHTSMVSQRRQLIASAPVSAGMAAAKNCTSTSSTVRFALRKRAVRPDESNEDKGTSSNAAPYNADFLSGLFADIAKANVLSELEIPASADMTVGDAAATTAATTKTDSNTHATTSTFATTTATTTDIHPRPSKKSRLSIATSFRARPSVKNLMELCESGEECNGPATQSRDRSFVKDDLSGMVSPRCMDDELRQQNSLAFQLKSLSSSPSSSSLSDSNTTACGMDTMESSTTSVPSGASSTHEVSPKGQPKKRKIIQRNLADDAVRLAFPNLPVTVSDSSCGGRAALARVNGAHEQGASNGPAVTSSTNSKESHFGWFVDLDEHHGAANSAAAQITASMPYAVSSDNLAFQAPTSSAHMAHPAVAEQVAEVEWAKAADTVDDVLGDFF